MRAALLGIVIGVLPGAAGASDFWESVLDPGQPRYRAAISAGKRHTAASEWGQALVQFERAVAAVPDRAEAHRLRGDVLAILERWEAAVDSWTRARALDPLLAYDTGLGFQIAVAQTRLGRSSEALEEYRRLLAVSGPRGRLRAVSLSNSAEILMSLGPERIEEAISSYRASLAEGPQIVAEWGFVLALDRAGRAAEAASTLERLRRADPRLTSLASEALFFYPLEEKHAYAGLGSEAFGDLDRAEIEWQAFLDAGGDVGPWADWARRHLEGVRARIGQRPARHP